MKSILDILAKVIGPEVPAMGRAGLKEITPLLSAFPDGMKPVEEMGMFGNKTPQEIYRAKHSMSPYMERSHERQMEMHM
jgi:hypothetical protein